MSLGQWLGFLSLVISLYILWQIRQILLLVFAAVVLATALNSAVRRLQQLGVRRRGIAVACVLACLVLVFILFFLLIVPPFIEQFQSLINLLPRGLEQLRFLSNTLRDNRPSWLPEPPDISSAIQQFQPLVTRLFGNFYAFFSNSLLALGQLLLVIILTLMMLGNPQAYRHLFVRLFPSFYRRRADQILTECGSALENWFGGVLISSFVVGIFSFFGLLFLGIKLVLAHALLAGTLNFIPNIGPTLSLVFPVSIALLESDALWKAGAVVILYIIIQNVESYFLTPTVMAKQVSLLPALTLLAQIVSAAFFGPLGLLLALPLAVVAQTWIREVLIQDILDRWDTEHPPSLRASVASQAREMSAQPMIESNPIVEPDQHQSVEIYSQPTLPSHPTTEPVTNLENSESNRDLSPENHPHPKLD